MQRASLLLLVVAVLWPASTLAKSEKELTYTFDTIWTTTIRYLRADRNFKITDRDRKSGYILFVYPGTGSVKECNASLEIISTVNENNHEVVRLQLRIAHQPSYIEIDLLDRLERKLRDDHGEPPAPREPRKKPPKKEKKPKGDEKKPPLEKERS
jgi:hypothetical protein